MDLRAKAGVNEPRRCYPDAEWDRLQVIGQLLLWLFLWDDEIDRKIDPSCSTFASTLTLGNAYRKQSLQYVENELNPQAAQKIEAPTGACGIFEEFAPTLLNAGAQVSISQLIEDVRCFITCNGEEQRLRLSGILPTPDHYWTFRHGTGGMDCLSTVVQCVKRDLCTWQVGFNKSSDTLQIRTSPTRLCGRRKSSP